MTRANLSRRKGPLAQALDEHGSLEAIPERGSAEWRRALAALPHLHAHPSVCEYCRPLLVESVRLVDAQGRTVAGGFSRWFIEMFARGTDNS